MTAALCDFSWPQKPRPAAPEASTVPPKPRSTASPAPRPRRKAHPDTPQCPVLAGFARMKQNETYGTSILVPAPDPIVSLVDTRAPSRGLFGALVLLIVLAVSALLAVRHVPGLTSDNDAAIAVRSYAHLCDSEIVAALRARNDGKLTGEQALEIIQQARPAIHRAAWSRIADRLTAMQTDDGQFEKDSLDRFLDEMHSGLSSF